MDGRRVVVFGRQPVPGRGKSRLAAVLGAGRTAEVSRILLEHTLRQAINGPWRAELHLADPVEGGWSPVPALPLRCQADGSLGQRLAAAFAAAFGDGAEAVLLVGSDCPGLARGHLVAAFRCLEERPVVLGPAADGGYWLVGQRAPGGDLFSGIPWSSAETLRATRNRLDLLGIPWHELATLADVDTISDLQRIVDAVADDDRQSELIRDLRRAMGRTT